MHEDDFKRYLGTFDDSQYMRDHRLRFVETWDRIAPHLQDHQRILELGSLSPIGRFLRDELHKTVTVYERDLRFPYDVVSASADVVLSLEVVEHLNDAHSADSGIEEIALFAMSGARRMFTEAHRILRPGGLLFLTTPNAVSIDTLGNVLNKRHPYQYAPHVREYALDDVVTLATESGFALAAQSTFFAWNAWPDVDRERLIEVFQAMGFDMADRGNDAFFVFRRPPG